MNNYISFSLYGNSQKYLTGAIENVKNNLNIYPEWNTVFYIGESVPVEVKQTLEGLGAKTFLVSGTEDASAMFWRFKSIYLPNVERVIFRDCDSRSNYREKHAVNEWLSSNHILHIMRDHPMHNAEILGGLWGIKVNDEIKSLLTIKQPLNGTYGDDQVFLKNEIYKKFIYSSVVHDSFFAREKHSTKFALKRFEGEFLGEPVDEFGKVNLKLRQMVIQVESSTVKSLKIKIKDKIHHKICGV